MANQRDVRRGHQSTDQWHTPQWILDRAQIVLDGIDLDPASSAAANKRVKAKRFFTAADDPLERDWNGSVFVNPPGGDTGRLLPKAFWNKLLEQIKSGHTQHALFLAYRLEMIRTTQTNCAHSLLEFPTCIFAKRLVFVLENGDPLTGNMSPSCLVYVPGKRNLIGRFKKNFGDSGVIVGG